MKDSHKVTKCLLVEKVVTISILHSKDGLFCVVVEGVKVTHCEMLGMSGRKEGTGEEPLVNSLSTNSSSSPFPSLCIFI